jgi:hypothetical protein
MGLLRSSMAFGTLVGMPYSTIAGHSILSWAALWDYRCTYLLLYDVLCYSLLYIAQHGVTWRIVVSCSVVSGHYRIRCVVYIWR